MLYQANCYKAHQQKMMNKTRRVFVTVALTALELLYHTNMYSYGGNNQHRIFIRMHVFRQEASAFVLMYPDEVRSVHLFDPF